MASCEKCWRDAGGSADRYAQLLLKRSHHPCTPEEQAGGELAQQCDKCGRRTRHMMAKKCMNPECK